MKIIILHLKLGEIEKLISQSIMIHEYKNDCLVAGVKYIKTAILTGFKAIRKFIIYNIFSY